MEQWEQGSAYEAFIGRWSRAVAREFLGWLGVPAGSRWLDIGCGTGALSATILDTAEPASVVGLDASAGFVAHARDTISDPRASFQVGDAQALSFADRSFDAAVSALVLNFLPDPPRALNEMQRVTRESGVVATYLWDYADGMELLARFWATAVALDPAAAELDEAGRFPLCQPEPLRRLFVHAGLEAVEVRAIEIPTVFPSFEDLWAPFLGRQGPAPSYTATLSPERQAALRERFRASLPIEADGAIRLTARAWAARGRVAPS